jgi:hypothetical protein
VWGKAFQSEGRLLGHVLDPRLGCPVAGAVMSATVTKSATDADAYSTALLVLGGEGLDLLARAEGVMGQLVVEVGDVADPPRISARGIALTSVAPASVFRKARGSPLVTESKEFQELTGLSSATLPKCRGIFA